MKRFIYLTGIFLTSCFTSLSGQQYPLFSQYYFNENVINPASTGNHVQWSNTLLYRNQWINFPGAPRTFNLTSHSSFRKNKIGLGFLVNHDEIGSYKNDHVYFAYAYKIHIRQATLAFGLQAGFNIMKADFSKLNLQSPDDASFFNINGAFKPNFGTGVLLHKKDWFVGLSVPFILNSSTGNIAEGAVTSIQQMRYYFLRGGAILPLRYHKNVKLNPSVLIRTQVGQPLTFDLNMAVILHDEVSAGVSYRLQDSFVTFLALNLSSRVQVAYSYDWTMSGISRFGRGTHEIVLNLRSIIRSIHGNPECPSFYQYR